MRFDKIEGHLNTNNINNVKEKFGFFLGPNINFFFQRVTNAIKLPIKTIDSFILVSNVVSRDIVYV